MTAEKFKRKLAAILSADVKGYSLLMGKPHSGFARTIRRPPMPSPEIKAV